MHGATDCPLGRRLDPLDTTQGKERPEGTCSVSECDTRSNFASGQPAFGAPQAQSYASALFPCAFVRAPICGSND
jgi:hypothetical protein